MMPLKHVELEIKHIKLEQKCSIGKVDCYKDPSFYFQVLTSRKDYYNRCYIIGIYS